MQECKQCMCLYQPKTERNEYCSENCRKAHGRGAKSPVKELNKKLKAKGLPLLKRGGEVKIEFLESNIEEINKLTGGFPKNRITEIFGMKGVGKTYLARQMIKKNSKTLYIDTENALVNVPNNIEVVNEYEVESVAEIVNNALESKIYDLIVIDSVASMSVRTEAEGEIGEAHMGLKARIMGQWMRTINPYLHDSGTSVVFINQERESMNPYGKQKFTPGGHALPYAASLRLELKTLAKDRIKKNGEQIGHWVNVKVEKSRVSKPYQETKFKLLYE